MSTHADTSAHETASAPPEAHVQWKAMSICGSVAADTQPEIKHAHRLV